MDGDALFLHRKGGYPLLKHNPIRYASLVTNCTIGPYSCEMCAANSMEEAANPPDIRKDVKMFQCNIETLEVDVMGCPSVSGDMDAGDRPCDRRCRDFPALPNKWIGSLSASQQPHYACAWNLPNPKSSIF